MTDEAKALGIRHAKITGKDMRDHWGPIVDRIADEISDPRDALIETQAREIERLRELLDAWLGLAREHLDTELAGRTFEALERTRK